MCGDVLVFVEFVVYLVGVDLLVVLFGFVVFVLFKLVGLC